LELRVYRGADGAFTLYEDEGDTYNYEKGLLATIPLAWDDAKQTLVIGDRKGEFPGMLKERTFNVVFVGASHGVGIDTEAKPDRIVRYSGKAMTVTP
jgi:alpha-D-xyloside xylohydrolase